MNPTKVFLSSEDIKQQIAKTFPEVLRGCKVYGVPNGGLHIAIMLGEMGLAMPVSNPADADFICDDLVASGMTRKRFRETCKGKDFWAPYSVDNTREWLVFPWESEKSTDGQDVVTRMLQHIGEDPSREGLVETPHRVVKSWKELYGGYNMDPEVVLGKHFASDNNEMVICKDIEFYSMCEHHILPIIGKVHIGYIPNGRVVGLSKLARLVEVYARRLQIQEQLTQQIADAIMKYIPGVKGVIVVVEAKHLCMCARGVNKQASLMTTSALKGCFTDGPCRTEFLSLIK